LCANQGYGCEPSDILRVPAVNRFLKLLPFGPEILKICLKSQKNPKNAKPIFLPSL
jgi:hypothetical protein